jgi:hypothetical protein
MRLCTRKRAPLDMVTGCRRRLATNHNVQNTAVGILSQKFHVKTQARVTVGKTRTVHRGGRGGDCCEIQHRRTTEPKRYPNRALARVKVEVVTAVRERLYFWGRTGGGARVGSTSAGSTETWTL